MNVFFFFGVHNFNGFALVAAERAEEQRVAAFALHDMHATVAHHLVAVRAFVGGVHLGMARTQHRAAFQHHRRLRTLTLKLGNRDIDLGGFDEQLHVAQMHRLAGKQPCLPDPVAVDERAVGRIAIAEHHAGARQLQFAVAGGHGGMINGEIAVRVAPDAIDAETQFKRPVFQTLYFDQKSGHVCSETDLTLRAEKTNVQKKMNSARPEQHPGGIIPVDFWQRQILRRFSRQSGVPE